ncbi:glucose dehydrogenase [Bradyrhizobium sp. SBR1B]|nr:glucose dehydrogenase [Bradyrhizobium sp. SBR1B]
MAAAVAIHRGPDDPDEITNQATPLKIGDLLYTCSPHQIVFALDGDRPVALEVRSTGPAQGPSST